MGDWGSGGQHLERDNDVAKLAGPLVKDSENYQSIGKGQEEIKRGRSQLGEREASEVARASQ